MYIQASLYSTNMTLFKPKMSEKGKENTYHIATKISPI